MRNASLEMKRHPALHDLARDHFFALSCARRIRKADDPRQAANDLARLWDADLVHHFREEEEVLLPLLARHLAVAGEPCLRQMLDDHAWLRDRVPEVARRVGAGEPFEDLLREVASRLSEHARLEDREVFPLVERTLTPQDLEDLATRSREFRLRNRGPASLGPRREEP